MEAAWTHEQNKKQLNGHEREAEGVPETILEGERVSNLEHLAEWHCSGNTGSSNLKFSNGCINAALRVLKSFKLTLPFSLSLSLSSTFSSPFFLPLGLIFWLLPSSFSPLSHSLSLVELLLCVCDGERFKAMLQQ